MSPRSKILQLLALAAMLSSSKPLAPQSVAKAKSSNNGSQSAHIHHIEDLPVDISMGNGQPSLHLTLKQLMKAYNDPAFSIAVVENFQIAWAKAYGVISVGSSTPVTVHTTFQAASISKPVTATATLSLVQEGKLSLDEDVNVRLVNWKVPDNEFTKTEKVTLRRVLSHTAGLTVHGFAGYDVDDPLPTVVQILNGEKPANSPPVRVDTIPGTVERYSGGGITIEQLVLTDVTGKSFPALLRETILGKLSMIDSSYEQPPSLDRAKFAATGTAADNKTLHGQWHIYPETAAAGLWTTPSDLARFLIDIALAKNGKAQTVLSQTTAQLMLTPVMGEAGLGFFLPKDSPGEFGHSGSNEGFECEMKMNANSGFGLVMMTNSDNGFEVMNFVESAVSKEYGWPVGRQVLDASARILLVSLVRDVPSGLRLYDSLRASQDPADKINEGTLNFLGERLLAIGFPEKAIDAYQRNLKEYPRSAGAYLGAAESYAKLGNKQLAITYFKASLELDPKNSKARDALAKLLAN